MKQQDHLHPPANIHLMLVSDQAAANLLPALDPAMKPKESILVVSQKMVAKANALKAVLQEAGIQTHTVHVPDEHNIAALEATLMNIATEREDQSIALNVTGGNKLMALAAQAVAHAAGWIIFYVDVDTDQVIWFDKTRPAQTLTQQLRLGHYLRGYGFSPAEAIERPQTNAEWQTLMNDLILNVGSLSQPIGQLNFLAQEARFNLRVNLTEHQLVDRSLEALLRKFEQAHLLQVKGNTLHFPSEAARSFANGGWIEHYVYQNVCQISGSIAIRDKAVNLKVQDLSGQPNEIDVAFLARNRLFVIECKTARMDNPDDLKANDTLYKLSENCRRIGGLGAKGMLVTYRKFRQDRDGSIPEQRLADALGVKVIQSEQLRRLDEHLKQWVMMRT